MNDPFFPLLVIAAALFVVGGGAGFYADHMRRKYEALADAKPDE